MTPPPAIIVKSHVLRTDRFGPSYMLFTISPYSPRFGVLTYFHHDRTTGEDREMPEPFDINITTNDLVGYEFKSSSVYPVETLRRIWNELLSDTDSDGWRPYHENDTLVNFYNCKANAILQNLDGNMDFPCPVPVKRLSQRRSSRRPFVPTPELVEDMKAAGQDPLDFVSFA